MTTKSFVTGKDDIVDYITKYSVRYSEAQSFLIEKTKSLKECRMLSSGEEMQFLASICMILNAKKTLDVGVFTGYSSLTIASILPETGKVLALDLTDEYMKDFCEPAWKLGGVRDRIEFFKGPALDKLNQLIADGQSGTFDFAFIDADKTNYTNYYEACMKLVRPFGVIAVDNVLWGGNVVNEADQSENTVAIRKLNELIRTDDRVISNMIRMGDGVTIAIKK